MADDGGLDNKPISEALNLSDRDTQKMLSKNQDFAQGLAQNVIKLEKDRQKSKEFVKSMEGINARGSIFHWKTVGAGPVFITEILKGNKIALIIFIIFILITLATSFYRAFALH